MTGARDVAPPHRISRCEKLYAALTANLQTIGLAGLRVEERMFIDARSRTDLFHNRDPALVESIREANWGSARSYLTCEVTGWRGQLVVTMFVRAMRLRGSLYLEWRATQLLPLDYQYYEVDSLSHDSGYAVRSALAHGAASAVPALLASPRRVSRHLSERLVARNERSWRRFDLWAGTSLRELASGYDENKYFLGIDSEMYVKVVQLRVLKHILDFLDAHAVDTSDFARQQMNINTSHTTNFVAGNVGAGAAVGANARGGDVKTDSAAT